MADIRIDIIVNSKQAVAGANAATAALQKTNTLSDSLSRSLIRTFAVFGALRAVKNAINALAEFDEAMATVGAITQATSSEMELFRQTAVNLGATTVFTAKEAADALVTLARAGFSVAESTAAVGDVLNLARAGGLGLADAADITATALRSFGIEAEDAARVTNVLVGTANNANTTVQQLGQAIKFVGPISKSLGVSFETTSAALGKLSDAGLKATLAGTGLRGILARLQAPTKALRVALKELGVGQEEIKVSNVGLVAALQRLKDAGLDGSRALETFGLRAGPAFAVLIDSLPALERANSRLENLGDIAKETADAIDSSLKGALTRVSSAYNTLIIEFGNQGPLSALTIAMNALAGAIRLVAANADILFVAVSTLFGVGLLKGIAVVTGVTTAFTVLAPVLAGIAATISVLNLGWKLLNATEERNTNIINAQFEAALKLGKVEATRRQTLGALVTLLERRAKLTEQGLKIPESLDDAIDRQRAGIDAVNKALEEKIALEQRAADAARQAPLDDVIEKLQREQELLQRVNAETKIQGELKDIVNKLEETQGDIGGDAEFIERLIKGNAVLRARKEILEGLGNPQEEFNIKQQALNRLITEFPERASEFTAKLKELQEQLREDTESPFEKVVAGIQKEIDALNKKAQLFPSINRLKELELQITGGIRDLTVLERIELTATLALLNRATDAEKARTEAAKKLTAERAKENALLKSNQAILDRDSGKTDRAAISNIQDLGGQGLSGRGQLAELEKLGGGVDVLNERLKVTRQLSKDNELGFLEFGRRIQELGDQGAEGIGAMDKALATLVTTIDLVADAFATTATNAIIDFIETGKFSFKEFAADIIKQILRIIVQLLVMRALQGLGVGGAAASAVGGAAAGATAREHGGTVQPGRQFLVGERGPELLTPGRTGSVTPNAASVAQEAPQINQQIVIVKDPTEIPQTIASGAADDAIMTVIARNADKVAKLTP